MPPAGLFWRGYVCDALLFWARTLRDYALHRLSRGDTRAARQSFTTATHLARYAMRYILHQSYTLVHEIGHTFRQDDWHCRDRSIEPTSNPDTPYCCFDFAAKAFQCRVRARLGLPNVQYNTAPSGDDFNNRNPSVSQETCSSDLDVAQMARVSCDTGVEGEPYHEARVHLSNVTCRLPSEPDEPDEPDEPSSPVRRTNPYESCLLLCEQLSQSPEQLAECRVSCAESAGIDPEDAAQPL